MLKAALIATATVASTFAAMADPAPAERDMSILSSEQRAQVVKLQSYGHRFDNAIDAIFAEAQKPDYRWTAPEPRLPAVDLVQLTPEVAAQIERLQGYGHRFDKAIAAILREASMTEYSWAPCSGADVTVLAFAPES